MNEKKYFTVRQTSIVVGLKPTMIDYLCRTGIVRPSGRAKPGRGRGRLYTFGDLVLLRAIERLLRSRLPVSKLKKALDTQRKLFKQLKPQDVLPRYLITDGSEVILEHEPGKFVDLTKDGQMAFAFIVDIEHAKNHVIEYLEKIA